MLFSIIWLEFLFYGKQLNENRVDYYGFKSFFILILVMPKACISLVNIILQYIPFFAILCVLRCLLNRMSLWRSKELTLLNRLKSLPPGILRKISCPRLKHFLEIYLYLIYNYIYICLLRIYLHCFLNMWQ